MNNPNGSVGIAGCRDPDQGSANHVWLQSFCAGPLADFVQEDAVATPVPLGRGSHVIVSTQPYDDA